MQRLGRSVKPFVYFLLKPFVSFVYFVYFVYLLLKPFVSFVYFVVKPFVVKPCRLQLTVYLQVAILHACRPDQAGHLERRLSL